MRSRSYTIGLKLYSYQIEEFVCVLTKESRLFVSFAFFFVAIKDCSSRSTSTVCREHRNRRFVINHSAERVLKKFFFKSFTIMKL